MAQLDRLRTNEDNLNSHDFRDKHIETISHPNDFTTADATLLFSTYPFLPPGDSFNDIPLHLIGYVQQFGWNEGVPGVMLGELGSDRRSNTAGSSTGQASITRIQTHGNSLAAALYRPSFYYYMAHPSLDGIRRRLFTGGGEPEWLKGLASDGVNMYTADLSDHLEKVIAMGSTNSLLYKLPFGIIAVRQDPKQRVTGITFFEQCALRSIQNSFSAGQFQIYDNVSMEYERSRPMLSVGDFMLSDADMVGHTPARNFLGGK